MHGNGKILAALIWAVVIGSSVMQALTLPTMPMAIQFPIPWPVLLGLPIVFTMAALFDNSIPGKQIIGVRVDRVFGAGAYVRFLRVLRPELLLSCMALAIGIVGMIRAVELGGPDGAYRISGFFVTAGIGFLVLHVARWKRGFYEDIPRKPDPAGASMSAASFWDEARKRRNVFFAVWVGWLVAGPALLWMYSQLFPNSMGPNAPIWAALGTWGIVIVWAGVRINRLPCYRCGGQAFSRPVLFLTNAKCRSCGVSFRSDSGSP